MFKYDVEENFTYHPPTDENRLVHEDIRRRAKDLAAHCAGALPDSPEKMLALRKLEEFVMWSNASIARHG